MFIVPHVGNPHHLINLCTLTRIEYKGSLGCDKVYRFRGTSEKSAIKFHFNTPKTNSDLSTLQPQYHPLITAPASIPDAAHTLTKRPDTGLAKQIALPHPRE